MAHSGARHVSRLDGVPRVAGDRDQKSPRSARICDTGGLLSLYDTNPPLSGSSREEWRLCAT